MLISYKKMVIHKNETILNLNILTIKMKKSCVTKFLLIILLITILNVSMLQANSATTLGVYKQGECIELRQTCADCSYINFTRVSYPDGTRAMNNTLANKEGSLFNLEFCNTQQLGRYIVEGIGDTEGVDTIFAYDFEVTLNGNPPPEGIVVVAFTIIFLLIFTSGLLFFFQGLEQAIKFDMDLYDVLKIWGAYFSMWIFYHFSQEYLGNHFINEISRLAISVGSITHVFLPLVSFMVSFILNNLKFKQKAGVTY